MRLPTTTIDRGGLPVVINQRDFNPTRDTVWRAAAVELTADELSDEAPPTIESDPPQKTGRKKGTKA